MGRREKFGRSVVLLRCLRRAQRQLEPRRIITPLPWQDALREEGEAVLAQRFALAVVKNLQALLPEAPQHPGNHPVTLGAAEIEQLGLRKIDLARNRFP